MNSLDLISVIICFLLALYNLVFILPIYRLCKSYRIAPSKAGLFLHLFNITLNLVLILVIIILWIWKIKSSPAC